jgi:formylglycine-generating enzyme required for sulfatase activity
MVAPCVAGCGLIVGDPQGHLVDPRAADAGADGCPGTAGPASVIVTSTGGSYCVDSTEVTNTQFAAFLAAGYSLAAASVPAGCEGFTSGTALVPPSDWPADPGAQNFPVRNLTWCQAYTYCIWAGKRLCGQIGGGPVAMSGANDPTVSQWFNACSHGGSLAYPYGNTFSPSTCGGATQMSSLANVKMPAACIGGFPGLYNMSGNVYEWTDACSSNKVDGFCLARGGAWDSPDDELPCAHTHTWQRNLSNGNIGFRCCADL